MKLVFFLSAYIITRGLLRKFPRPNSRTGRALWDALRLTGSEGHLELRRFSGEALGHLAAVFSNCTGLVKSRAEWRRTGL